MSTQTYGITMLPPEALLADDNVRYKLKTDRIEALAQNILEQGEVMVALEVETLPEPEGDKTHRVTDGHYRLAAVTKLNKGGAGLMLPCRVVEIGDPIARMKRQLSTALVRENLSTMDTARAIQKLLDAGVPKVEVRSIFSRSGGRKGQKVQPASNSFVNMMLSFLDFPKDIQGLIHDGTIGVGGAYALRKKPADKWSEVAAQYVADAAAAQEQEEKDEEKYLEQERKGAEARQKEEQLQKDLEAAKVALSEKAAAFDKAIEVETELFSIAKKAPAGEDKKKAEEAFKAASEATKLVAKEAEDAKKAADKLEKKFTSAQQNAEERKAKLAEAREQAAKDAKNKGTAKGAKKGAGPKEIEKAAQKVGAPSTVPLNAAQMKKAVADWALPGSFAKVRAIFVIVQDCFNGGATPDQAYAKMAKVTGEKK